MVITEKIQYALETWGMSAYPSADLAVVAGAGHDFQWTHPEAALRPIVRYLDAIGF